MGYSNLTPTVKYITTDIALCTFYVFFVLRIIFLVQIQPYCALKVQVQFMLIFNMVRREKIVEARDLLPGPHGTWLIPEPANPLISYHTGTLQRWSYSAQPFIAGDSYPRSRAVCLSILFESLNIAATEHCGILDNFEYVLFETHSGPKADFKTIKDYIHRVFGERMNQIVNSGPNDTTSEVRFQGFKPTTEKERRGAPHLQSMFENVQRFAKSLNKDFTQVSMKPLFSKKGCKQQYLHRDPSTLEAAPGEYPCVSVIITIQDGTSLVFRNKDGTPKIVKIPLGMGIAFRADRVHAGAEYKVSNWRFHCIIKKRHHRLKGNVVINPFFCSHDGCGEDFFNVTDKRNHEAICPLKTTVNDK